MPPSTTDLDQDSLVLRQEFADHMILRPPNKLKLRAAKYVNLNGQEDPDPVRRAENALKLLANEFDSWMESEIHRLEAARVAAGRSSDLTDRTELFRVAHDMRGQAATLGFPLVGMVADGLCSLLERGPREGDPRDLIDLHVDAIKAIVRENVRNPDDPVGAAIVRRLADLRGPAA